MKQVLKSKFTGSLDRTYLRWKSWTHQNRGRFVPKLLIDFSVGEYRVRTVSNISDLQRVLRLRYEVFIREGLNKNRALKLDLDAYDFLADHLVVENRETGEILGTYRIISSLFSDRFYSENEFELGDLLRRPGHKLELGRACIRPQYRTGAIIALLWRGVKQYMDATQTRYMFGCASIKTMSLEKISLIYHYLMEKGHFSSEFRIVPTEEFRIRSLGNGPAFALSDSAELRSLIPSLLRSYFKAGAVVVGEPALDSEFQCIDFLTILDTQKLEGSYEKRFSKA